jgi:hypothetical protein
MRFITIGLLAAAAVGCGNNNTYYIAQDLGVHLGGDGGEGACPPNTKQCVSPTLARVCPADGSGWLGVQCGANEVCMAGDCKFDATNALCTSADDTCVGNTTAAHCNANGMGFTMTTCPANTVCVGNGMCAGSCVVGESKCDDRTGALVTCTDGNTFTAAPCPANQACVTVQPAPNGQAVCLGGVCMPDANGCDTFCGNKLDSSADQTKFISQCMPTPTGFNWLVTACQAPATCDPMAGSFCRGPSGSNAACATVCTPNSVRCTPDFSGTQLCDPATANWGAITTCDLGSGQVCLFPNGGSNAVCGDAFCATGAQGTCVVDSGTTKFRACGSNGKLGDPAPCATGVCVNDPNVMPPQPSPAPQPGFCQVECVSGDQHCISTMGSWQACGSNGVWSTMSTPCSPTSLSCFNFISATGRPAIVCGVCQPGAHRCVNGAGNPDGGAPTLPQIETCGTNGQWGTAVPCTVGQCQDNGANDFACIAECLPNVTKRCVGASVVLQFAPIEATQHVVTCNANGFFPTGTGTLCGTNQFCRRDSSGNSLGCVLCVSGPNEAGLTDTRCSNLAGTDITPAVAVQTCGGGVWTTPPAACTTPYICHDPTGTAVPALTCLPCSFDPTGGPCTDGRLPGGCVAAGEGAPISCADQFDCCSNDCGIDPTLAPAPATCGP